MFANYCVRLAAAADLDARYDVLVAAQADPGINWEQLLDLIAASLAM